MKIEIAFYRIRDVDDAHAIVGRETAEAADLDEAIEIALELLRTLDMPQRPDAMTITDGDGSTIHSSSLDTIENLDERHTTMNAHRNEIEARRHALAISIWENEGGTSAPELMDHQHGRHIEMDRPWRIYHVSIGASARVDDNLRYIERRIKRISLSAPARLASRETEAR